VDDFKSKKRLRNKRQYLGLGYLMILSTIF